MLYGFVCLVSVGSFFQEGSLILADDTLSYLRFGMYAQSLRACGFLSIGVVACGVILSYRWVHFRRVDLQNCYLNHTMQMAYTVLREGISPLGY